MIKTILNNVSSILFAIAIVVAVWMLLPRIDQFLRITAINDCGQVARYEFRPNINDIFSYPMGDEYKKCLKDKGY